MASLVTLPRELLRSICGHLPCASALSFLLVCRSIYRDCNDWTVWKEIARRDLEAPAGMAIPLEEGHDRWKRYVVAAAKASRAHGDWAATDLKEWMPQLAALACPDVVHGSALSLCQLYLKLLRSATGTDTGEPTITAASLRSGMTFSPDNLRAGTLAQAAAFVLTVRHLSLPAVAAGEDDLPLKGEAWLFIEPREDTPDINSVPTEEAAQTIVLQHALASRAVGLFCTQLRAIRPWTTTPRLYAPPVLDRMPISRLMGLPPPFTSQGFAQFSRSHLRTMTEPAFFIESVWTGYISLTVPPGYVGIGGPYHDGFAGPGGPGTRAPDGNFPHGRVFEGVVRFQLVGGYDGTESYRLESNNFHCENYLHHLIIMVQRKTGQLVIEHWYPILSYTVPSLGVITPFGIVSWFGYGTWLWLWKVDWSANANDAE